MALNGGGRCQVQIGAAVHKVRSRRMELCGIEQRAPPTFGRAAITLGIGPHSSSCLNKIQFSCSQQFKISALEK